MDELIEGDLNTLLSPTLRATSHTYFPSVLLRLSFISVTDISVSTRGRLAKQQLYTGHNWSKGGSLGLVGNGER